MFCISYLIVIIGSNIDINWKKYNKNVLNIGILLFLFVVYVVFLFCNIVLNCGNIFILYGCVYSMFWLYLIRRWCVWCILLKGW